MGVLKPRHSGGKGEVNPFKEKQWVRNVREKEDRNAFENIFRAYYQKLYHFAYTYVGPEFAEDVVQTVFLKIWDKREQWAPPGTVKQYLFAAVRNESLNLLRRQKMEMEAEETVTNIFNELKRQNYSDDTPETERLKAAIEEGISQLPPRCRQIFILNRRSGLTYSEIAETLDVSFNTVSTQMGRALKRLQAYLSDYLPVLFLYFPSLFL